jgi:two-component system, chemotaxis family, chemotaxis protein CheY
LFPPAHTEGTVNMKSGTTKSVIIIDADPAYRALLKKILKNLDCNVVGESSGGQEAVHLYQRKKSDIVLLDIMLPNKFGLDVLKKIINLEPNQVVIMMTSESDQQTVQSCIAAGAKGYVLKTDSANSIRDRIGRFFI